MVAIKTSSAKIHAFRVSACARGLRDQQMRKGKKGIALCYKSCVNSITFDDYIASSDSAVRTSGDAAQASQERLRSRTPDDNRCAFGGVLGVAR